jgi:DNA-binding NtrC family response regulator
VTVRAADSRVLVVQEEALVRDVLVRLLRHEGHRVDAAPTAEQALEQLRRERFDLVLLDLDLSPGCGFLILASVRALQAHAGVVVMTVSASPDTVGTALELGASGVVAKPFRTHELLLAVARAGRPDHRGGPRHPPAAAPPRLHPAAPEPANGGRGVNGALEHALREGWTLERLEREYILGALRATGGHRANAAALLGVHPRTLSRKLRRYEGADLPPGPVAQPAHS